jgi:hypothetical protein
MLTRAGNKNKSRRHREEAIFGSVPVSLYYPLWADSYRALSDLQSFRPIIEKNGEA